MLASQNLEQDMHTFHQTQFGSMPFGSEIHLLDPTPHQAGLLLSTTLGLDCLEDACKMSNASF